VKEKRKYGPYLVFYDEVWGATKAKRSKFSTFPAISEGLLKDFARHNCRVGNKDSKLLGLNRHYNHLSFHILKKMPGPVLRGFKLAFTKEDGKSRLFLFGPDMVYTQKNRV